MKVSQNVNISSHKKIKRRSQLRNNIDAWILMLPMVVILYLFVWRPTVMGTVWSFFDMKGYTVKDFFFFVNYVKVLTHTQFLQKLRKYLE